MTRKLTCVKSYCRDNMSKVMKGRIFTAEHRKKLSEAAKRRVQKKSFYDN